MKVLIFIFLLSPYDLHAKYAIKESNGDIILKGGNCEELQKEAQEIFNWAYKLKDLSKSVSLTCHYTEFLGTKWGYEINISKVVPALVKKYLNYGPSHNGPNCWNSTLVVNKISPFLRYSTAEEFSFWLNSPLCHKRTPEEKIESGDIIAIREYNNNMSHEYHGFTYISSTLSFTKNGFDKRNPYELVATDDVFNTYGVKLGCRLPPHEKNCSKAGIVYTCKAFETYLTENLPQEISDAYLEIQKTDCLVEQLSLFGNNKSNKKLFSFIDMNIDMLQWLIEDLKNKPYLNEKEKFIVNALYVKIISMKSQLKHLN